MMETMIPPQVGMRLRMRKKEAKEAHKKIKVAKEAPQKKREAKEAYKKRKKEKK